MNDKNKKRNFLLVFGLLLLSFALVFGGLISRNMFRQDYPLVFIDANNRLMYITKSDNDKNDIVSHIESTSIVYANNNTKMLLYTNNKALYLLDTQVGGEGIKIVDDTKEYGFSLDDKYVYYIDSNNKLNIYNRSNSEYTYIYDKVNKVDEIKDNHILYNSNGKLMHYNIDNKENDEIYKSYDKVEINSDNRLVLYSVNNNNLKDYYIYNTVTKDNKKILEGVIKVYDKDSNYNKLIYTKPAITKMDLTKIVKDEDKDNNTELKKQIKEYINKYELLGVNIYYQNGNNNTLIASNVNELYYNDIKSQRYSYTKYRFDNNSINISSYKDIEEFYNDFESKKYNSLYFKVSTNEESSVYRNVTSKIKVNIRNDNELYIFVKNNEYYDLYYTKISNKQARMAGQIDSNIINNKFNTEYIDGYLFINYINEHYYLNLLSDGRVRTLVTDINPKYYAVSEGKDSIYYLKKTGDHSNDLVLYNGIRNSKIATDVHNFIYLNNDLIYVSKNYNDETKTGDLYRISNNHLTLIYKDITDWYNPLNKDIDKEESEVES